MALTSDTLVNKKGRSTTVKESDVLDFVEKNISSYVTERISEFEGKINLRIDSKETKTTEILAIFITLFTFISVNITIFSRVDDVLSAVFFMFLVTLLSATLLSLMFFFISEKRKMFTGGFTVICLMMLTYITFSLKSDYILKLKLNSNKSMQKETAVMLPDNLKIENKVLNIKK